MDKDLFKIAFVSSGAEAADAALRTLEAEYSNVSVAECDAIVALGGDGFMLYCLHKYLDRGKPIYGMNRGSVGFLMNEYSEDGLLERVRAAHDETLYPLRMVATTAAGEKVTALAFNEVSLLRSSRQSANFRILVDGKTQLEPLIADGVLVSTPAGSTAYNLSVHGPVLPIGSGLLAITPISPFRPRRWRGALLPHSAVVRIENMDPGKRPVSASADQTEVHEVVAMEISECGDHSVRMLFDEGHSLNERILREQFVV